MSVSGDFQPVENFARDFRQFFQRSVWTGVSSRTQPYRAGDLSKPRLLTSNEKTLGGNAGGFFVGDRKKRSEVAMHRDPPSVALVLIR